jgi:hypothetical protein
MRQDVIAWSQGNRPTKIISKETLNHPELIEFVSGTNVYQNTPRAYLMAYKALGIDIINRVPAENAPVPTPYGQKRQDSTRKDYFYTSLGVYDTAFRNTFPCKSVDEVWDLGIENLAYEDLLVPVPHSCESHDIKLRENAIGNIGLYYPLLYTTLFMWAVEVLGWEVFLIAASQEPRRFYEKFLLPCAVKSEALVAHIASVSDGPFLFLHDDLADAKGPIFRPSWYSEYIFPLYKKIFAPAKKLGKKIIFVADGNMTSFLGRLVDVGVDGIMYENPATSLDAIIEYFGQEGKYFIGGIETTKLTFASPDEIKQMVFDLFEKCSDYRGFAISSCGGLHGNIPLENLVAYFDARAEIGATAKNWRDINGSINLINRLRS